MPTAAPAVLFSLPPAHAPASMGGSFTMTQPRGPGCLGDSPKGARPAPRAACEPGSPSSSEGAPGAAGACLGAKRAPLLASGRALKERRSAVTAHSHERFRGTSALFHETQNHDSMDEGPRQKMGSKLRSRAARPWTRVF